jgi:hypothetical protein
VLILENSVIRHQNKNRFVLPEPPLPSTFNLSELFSVLKAAVQSHDSMRTLPGSTNPLGAIDHRVAQIETPPFSATHDKNLLVDFYCIDDYAADGYAIDACVSAIQRYGDTRRFDGRADTRNDSGFSRGRARLPPEACKHPPCSRTHPPNECCICRAPHPITRCWHVLGLPDALHATLNSFKKLCQAKEGPWLPKTSTGAPSSSRTVASLQPSSVGRSPINFDKPTQTATEDAVDTVVHDALEAYRSPWLVNILKEKLPSVNAIDTTFCLPLDGTLPAELVARVDAFPTDTPSLIYAYLHVDTGATCFVTNHSAELHCPIPTRATCGTATTGPRATINALGTLLLDFITTTGEVIAIEASQTPEIRSFQRRSMSAHALQELGYDVEHCLLSTGNVLRLRHVSASTWHTVSLTTVGKADFVKVRLHRPNVANHLVPPIGHCALTSQSVSRIDLVTKFQGTQLLNLVHLRHGCPSKRITEQLVRRIDPSFQLPPEWYCCVCMSEKTKSLPRNPTVGTLFLPIGARLQMDFGFYNIPSIRGFTCFLAVVEAKTSYRWCFLRRSKHPPINLSTWFINHARKIFGFNVVAIRTDGGG